MMSPPARWVCSALTNSFLPSSTCMAVVAQLYSMESKIVPWSMMSLDMSCMTIAKSVTDCKIFFTSVSLSSASKDMTSWFAKPCRCCIWELVVPPPSLCSKKPLWLLATLFRNTSSKASTPSAPGPRSCLFFNSFKYSFCLCLNACDRRLNSIASFLVAFFLIFVPISSNSFAVFVTSASLPNLFNCASHRLNNLPHSPVNCSTIFSSFTSSTSKVGNKAFCCAFCNCWIFAFAFPTSLWMCSQTSTHAGGKKDDDDWSSSPLSPNPLFPPS